MPELEQLSCDPNDFKGSGLPRSEGVHVTAVLKDIFDRVHGGYGAGFSDEGLSVAGECGFVWEEVLEEVFSRKYADRMLSSSRRGNMTPFRPPELFVDGIYLSPDGVGPDPSNEYLMAVYEYKFTWRSMNKTPLDIWMYQAQSMCYCHALRTNVAVFDILHCCGNYRDIREPQRQRWRIEYLPLDLDRHWDMVLEHAATMKEEEDGH